MLPIFSQKNVIFFAKKQKARSTSKGYFKVPLPRKNFEDITLKGHKKLLPRQKNEPKLEIISLTQLASTSPQK